jgi:hypothetical protein
VQTLAGTTQKAPSTPNCSGACAFNCAHCEPAAHGSWVMKSQRVRQAFTLASGLPFSLIDRHWPSPQSLSSAQYFLQSPSRQPLPVAHASFELHAAPIGAVPAT